MKVYEVLELAKPFIEKLNDVGVNPKDIKYINMYKEYKRLKDEGHKMAWITSILAAEYEISERQVAYIASNFSKDLECK